MYNSFCLDLCGPPSRLVTRLGLKSNLTEYKVPTTDLPKIAGGALGGTDGPEFPKVVKMLEGLFA
jgi:hypothetical protein